MRILKPTSISNSGTTPTSIDAYLHIHDADASAANNLLICSSDDSNYYFKVASNGRVHFRGNSVIGDGQIKVHLQHSSKVGAASSLIWDNSSGQNQMSIRQSEEDSDLFVYAHAQSLNLAEFARTTADVTFNAKTRINGQGSDILTLWNNESTPVNVFKVMHTGDIELGRDGQQILVSTFAGADADGDNIWIGGGGLLSVGDVSDGRVGSSNIAIGVDAMLNTTTGKDNVAIGLRALGTSTEGVQNVAIGYESLYDLTTGNWNTATGYKASANTTTGSYNTSLGFAAGFGSTTADANTSIGYAALYAMTSGEQNTALGKGAGWGTSNEGSNLDCNNSVFVGHHAVPKLTGETNQIVIGHNTTGNGSNTVTLGNDNVTGTYLQGTINLNDYQTTDADGTPVKTLGVDASGNVVKFDGSTGTLDGTGVANQVAWFDDADTLTSGSWLTVNNSIAGAEGLLIGSYAEGKYRTAIGHQNIVISSDDDSVNNVFAATGYYSSSNLSINIGDTAGEVAYCGIKILQNEGKTVLFGKTFLAADSGEIHYGVESPSATTGHVMNTKKSSIFSATTTPIHTHVNHTGTGNYTMIVDYTVNAQGGGAMRTGRITGITDGTSISFTDSVTASIGDTSDFELSFDLETVSTQKFLRLNAVTTVATGFHSKYIINQF